MLPKTVDILKWRKEYSSWRFLILTLSKCKTISSTNQIAWNLWSWNYWCFIAACTHFRVNWSWNKNALQINMNDHVVKESVTKIIMKARVIKEKLCVQGLSGLTSWNLKHLCKTMVNQRFINTERLTWWELKFYKEKHTPFFASSSRLCMVDSSWNKQIK